MKKIILVVMFFLTFTSFMSLNAQWARTYGGSADERPRSIQQTSDGGYIVAGYTESFAAGSYDVWILKLSSTGAIEWQRAYGGGVGDSALSIQQTSDGGYIVAGSTLSFGAGSYDILVLKLSSTGAIEWQRAYGGFDDDYTWFIQQTSDGGYIVAGSTLSFGAGYSDIWVIKLSSNGAVEWQRTYGGSDDDWCWAIPIQQTSDGGYIVAGESYSFGDGSDDAWILKLSSTGDIEWQRIYGGSDQDWSDSIQQTSDGGYIVAGGSYSFGTGSRDIWILKLSSTGAIEWQRTYGGSDFDHAYCVQQTSDGGYVVEGFTDSFGAGYSDIWVIKLSSNGAVEWQRTYGGSDDDWPRSIQQTSDGGYIVAAITYSFGAGEGDFLVLKLYSDGDIDPSCGFIGGSTASVINTYISPVNTNITPGSTYVTPLATSVFPQDTYVTANLLCEAPKYTLIISVTTGGTTDPAPGSHTYYSRTEVQIEAIPDTGYRFSGWTGDVPSGHENDNPITITMDSNKSVTANFIRQYTLTIAAGTGGTTNPSPESYIYDVGTQVSVRAIPNSGYRFAGWSGDASGATNPITITMDSDKSIKANFAKEEPPAEKKGGCFIATAAYDSPLHPYVETLREFRDSYLMPSKLGRKLVILYYKYSPFAANLITKHKALKVAVRIMLLPLVAFSYSILHFGPIITAVMIVFIFMFPVFLILFFKRKLRRAEAKDLKKLASLFLKKTAQRINTSLGETVGVNRNS